MPGFKIVHDRPNCIGCGACVAMCPEFWQMVEDGKSELKGAKQKGENFELEVNDPKCIQDAADACPVNVIHVFDKAGKKLK